MNSSNFQKINPVWAAFFIVFAVLSGNALANEPEGAARKERSERQAWNPDQQRIDFLVKESIARGAKDTPALREAIRKDVARKSALLKEARRLGVDRQNQVRTRIEIAGQDVIIQAHLAEWVKSKPVTDDMIQAEYQNFLKSMGDKEFSYREIIVLTEEEAKGVLARIKTGETFESIASKQTLDTSARSTSGLKEWINSKQMDPALAEMLGKLGKGQLSTTPVQTGRVWRVVKLESSRPYSVPSLSTLKDQISRQLTEKLVSEYVDSLVTKSVTR